MTKTENPQHAYWREIHALTRYVEFLRHGGDPNGEKGRPLRREAFPDGPTPTLAAIHSELATVRPREPRRERRPQPPTALRQGQLDMLARLAARLGVEPPVPSCAAEASLLIGQFQRRAKRR